MTVFTTTESPASAEAESPTSSPESAYSPDWTLETSCYRFSPNGLEFNPFGQTFSQSGTYADANPWRFSTKQIEPAWNLYYYGYRYYSPNLQVWLSRDPIEERGRSAGNPYSFLRLDPIARSDPKGLSVVLSGNLSHHGTIEQHYPDGTYDVVVSPDDTNTSWWERLWMGASTSASWGEVTPASLIYGPHFSASVRGFTSYAEHGTKGATDVQLSGRSQGTVWATACCASKAIKISWGMILQVSPDPSGYKSKVKPLLDAEIVAGGTTSTVHLPSGGDTIKTASGEVVVPMSSASASYGFFVRAEISYQDEGQVSGATTMSSSITGIVECN